MRATAAAKDRHGGWAPKSEFTRHTFGTYKRIFALYELHQPRLLIVELKEDNKARTRTMPCVKLCLILTYHHKTASASCVCLRLATKNAHLSSTFSQTVTVFLSRDSLIDLGAFARHKRESTRLVLIVKFNKPVPAIVVSIVEFYPK